MKQSPLNKVGKNKRAAFEAAGVNVYNTLQPLPGTTPKKDKPKKPRNRGRRSPEEGRGDYTRINAQGERGKENARLDAKWRREVRARFVCPELCQYCNEEPTFEIHHGLTKARHPEFRHDPRCGIPLCLRCHTAAHANMRAFIKEWASRNAEFAALLSEAKTMRKEGA